MRIFFTQSYETVFAAKSYSERISLGLIISETSMVIIVLRNLCLLAQQFILAFIDGNTMLQKIQ